MSNPALTILRKYAKKSNPTTLPLSVRFAHTEKTLTVFDAFPKSVFHLLVLPRLYSSPTLTEKELTDLRSLLHANKKRAKETLLELKKDALDVKAQIEEEMQHRYGYKWDVWMGFHALSSMEHLHLHVISSDLCGRNMKNKKHYNSFHPKLGFFLHIDDVLEWFDAQPSFFEDMSKLKKSTYYPLLKDDLVCWRCDKVIKNMPMLIDHLKDDSEKEAKTEKARLERKRKREEAAISPRKRDSGSHAAAAQPEEPAEPTNESS